MKKLVRAASVVALIVVTTIGVILIKPWAAASSVSSAASSASAKPPPDLVADGVKLGPRDAKTTVTAVGTLVPNESVAIASEISRRVSKIHFEDGATVKAGDILFELDSADLAARSNENYVRRKVLVDNEARQKKLLAGGIGTQIDYDKARSELDLNDAQSATIAVDLAKTKIRAPFDGRLGLRTVSVGAMLSPGMALVTLQDTTRVKVDFTVPERFAPLVKPDSRFTFRIEANPTTFEGTVKAMEPAVAEGTRSLRVRGLADVQQGLVPGGSATVELVMGTAAGSLFVPSEAVLPSLGGHAVYRYEDGVAKLVDVELGLRTQAEVQITKGLKDGDVILVTNILRLRPNGKVKLGKVTE